MNAVQWPTLVSIIMSVLAGSLGFTAYAFTTFETHDSSQATRESIERRLDRIEAKLDQIAERRR